MNDLPLVPNPDESIAFLRGVRPNRPTTLAAIKEGEQPRAKTFELDNVADAATARSWITEHNTAGFNVYFQVNDSAEEARDRKAKKQDITQCVMLHVDVDDPSETALARLISADPKPSVIIASGGGYQAFWLLETPVHDIPRVELYNKALAEKLGGDNCHNADRIMRLPGTINWPNAKKRAAGRVPVLARVVNEPTDYSSRYTLEDFDLALETALVPSRTMAAMPSDLRPATVEQAGLTTDDPLAVLIQTGFDRKLPSRSEAVFKAATQLLRREVSPEIVAGNLLNPGYGISASVREKPSPEAYAWRQVQRAQEVIEDGWPDMGKAGPRSTYRNSLLALKRMDVELHYDLFRLRINVQGVPVQEFAGDMTDDVIAILRKLATDLFGFDPGKIPMTDAAHTLALEHARHPIRDYLDLLVWDGKKRFERLLIDYFGAKDTELNRAFATAFLVAAVRRVRKPGSKFDTMLVLEGAQGTGKSTAIKILAGEENFSDQRLIGLDQKAQGELLQGVWVSEQAELSGMKHTDVNDLKSFMSRDTDRFRPAYGRFVTEMKRQCVFIGTTNDENYLKDETGNRRFWPVKTGAIDLEALERDRDQIWAEAAQLEASGYPTVLPKELWDAATKLQSERMPHDPWLDELRHVEPEERLDTEVRASTKYLFGSNGVNIPAGQRQDYHAKRLGRAMRALGWDGPKSIRVNGRNERGYSRPRAEDDKSPDF